MTREQFRRAGYKVLSCKPNAKCFDGDHVHCQLIEGLEYCPNGRRILILSTLITGKQVHQLCLEDVQVYVEAIISSFSALHPDWELKDISFA